MKQGKILIIDDEQDVRDIVRMHLESDGFNVLEARDGEEAIDLMKAGSNLVNVGLIICDVRMPKINGLEAVDYLRENAKSIPIIILTGYPDTELSISFMNKGVKDYLVKPVERELLLEKVRKHIFSKQEFKYC